MTLNAQQDEYALNVETAGVRLVVHDQETMPFPEDVGITLNPGSATSVSIKKVP